MQWKYRSFPNLSFSWRKKDVFLSKEEKKNTYREVDLVYDLIKLARQRLRMGKKGKKMKSLER
jgi:hypothetical protein